MREAAVPAGAYPGTMTRLHTLSLVLRLSGDWMLWNTILAWIPVLLAVVLFRRDAARRRGPLWWCGVVVFGLFLPNAPYVVTDLVHLRETIRWLGPGAPVATTVYPLYAVFVLSGFTAYTIALAMAGGYVRRAGYDQWRVPLRLATHAVVAVGMFLGRWPRINSWEPFTDPAHALVRIGHALLWSRAPLLILALFAVTAVGHFATKAALKALLDVGRRGGQTGLGR